MCDEIQHKRENVCEIELLALKKPRHNKKRLRVKRALDRVCSARAAKLTRKVNMWIVGAAVLLLASVVDGMNQADVHRTRSLRRLWSPTRSLAGLQTDQTLVEPPISGRCDDGQRILTLINELRSEQRAPVLSWDDGLANSAQASAVKVHANFLGMQTCNF